ncbi:MAG: GIY-YIG nuclease family protein [Niabella sp.]
MFAVYIIYSATLDRYYVGYTFDLELRLVQHNTGISTYTSKARDWMIKYTESFDSREQAMAREREIKKRKSRKYIEGLIKE